MNIKLVSIQIILFVDTLRELKKFVGLNDEDFLSVFVLPSIWVNSTFFCGQPIILFCINVIFTVFFVSTSFSFFSALTKVKPFDFEDLSDLAEFKFPFGETIVGYCLDKDSKLAGLDLAVAGKGVFGHQFSYVLSCGLKALVP